MNEMEFYPEWVENYHVDTRELSACIEQRDYLYLKQKGQIYLCRPWTGIAVWANKVWMEALPCKATEMMYPFIKLNYCIRGRCEVLLENGKYIYLSDGMLSIDSNQVKGMFRYPTREYEGLEIVLNLAELEKCPLTILDELGVGIGQLQEFIKCDRGSFISGVSAEWDTLARNLMGLLETAKGRMEDYRFYSLQLLYLLNAGHTRSNDMETKRIALLGQPNSGKSTIFNTLTGMHQHVGNWPGKTVEKKEGTFTRGGVTYQVADLPGSWPGIRKAMPDFLKRWRKPFAVQKR